MNDKKFLSDTMLSLFVIFFLLITFVFGRNLGYELGYKEGQIDFQNHIVEWLVISPDNVIQLKD